MNSRVREKEKRAACRTGTRLASLSRALHERGWVPGQVAGWDNRTLGDHYTRLCESRLRTASLPLAAVSMELLYAHRPDTVRGNMYLVVSAGWLPDTSDTSYDCTQRLLNNLRLVGVVPFAWVVDNVRRTIKHSSWSGLADFAETVAQAYRMDFWARLPAYVEVIVEKDTVAGKLSQVTLEYDVPLHPIRGYNSTTFAHNIARGWDEIEKPITVYYMGDHDPSGRDLERDLRERLSHFSDRPFTWQRLAIGPEQFERYGVRPLKPKKKDSRYHRFMEQWPDGRCAEVEAVPANEQRRLVREAIESHIPPGEWERLQEVERQERQTWNDYMRLMFPGG